MATDDVIPLYCVKQRFGKHNVFVVFKQINGCKSRDDKLISVFSNKKDAQMWINKRQGW